VLIDRTKYKKKNTFQFAKAKECELITDLKGDK
jgi:hypothetical protein